MLAALRLAAPPGVVGVDALGVGCSPLCGSRPRLVLLVLMLLVLDARRFAARGPAVGVDEMLAALRLTALVGVRYC